MPLLGPHKATAWINARRLRAHGLVLAVCLWGTYVWIMTGPGLTGRNGLVKGADFLHFYTLGSLALEHRGAELYDMQAQSALAEQRVPQAGRLYFVALYGPQVSLLFAPLAALPYGLALGLWLIGNAVLYGACCYLVWKTCASLQSDRTLAFLLALAYPAFFHLMAWGQTSALVLACFTGAYLALRSDKMFVAGLAIGCLIVKPQLGLAVAVVFLAARQWKVFLGAAIAAMAQLSIGWAFYGTPVMREYFGRLLHVRDVMPQLEPRLYQMHSLRAFWTLLVPWQEAAFWIYAASAAVILWVAIRCWKPGGDLRLGYSALLVATVLVAPHLTVYDLVILAPAFLLLTDWALNHRSPSLGPLLYACYILPLAGPLARWTHVQLSVIAMAGLLWVIQRSEVSTGKNQTTDAATPAYTPGD
jgi:arabinofuranan 3-O-arabinosyltransferase